MFADIAAVRLSPATLMSGTASEVMVTVPVRKPNRQEFVRVHPDPAMSVTTLLLEDKFDRGSLYYVPPNMRAALVDEAKVYLLSTAITRQGTCFLWPVVMPTDGRPSAWSEGALEAVKLAKEKWLRVGPDWSLGSYRLYQAQSEVADPVWPEKTLNELLDIAFKKKVIVDASHPIVRRLVG
jgi:hypothetical protein